MYLSIPWLNHSLKAIKLTHFSQIHFDDRCPWYKARLTDFPTDWMADLCETAFHSWCEHGSSPTAPAQCFLLWLKRIHSEEACSAEMHSGNKRSSTRACCGTQVPGSQEAQYPRAEDRFFFSLWQHHNSTFHFRMTGFPKLNVSALWNILCVCVSLT